MPTEGPSSDDCRLGSLPPTVPEPLPENSRSASDGSGWIQVSAKCLVCERKFKVWVPDTPQNERDASETVMTRLKQHLWAIYEEHCFKEAQIKHMLKNVRVDVQEHADDKPLVAKIVRKRKAVAQPTESMEDQAQPPTQPLITMSRWPGSRSSPSAPFVTGSEGMNLEKQDRARRYLSTIGTAELRDMVRLVMNEWQQRESGGL